MRVWSDYGMLFVLAALCVVLSLATRAEQQPAGAVGGRRLAEAVGRQFRNPVRVLIVVRPIREDDDFAAELKRQLEADGHVIAGVIRGEPAEARKALAAHVAQPPDAIACPAPVAGWSIFDVLNDPGGTAAPIPVMKPASYRGSNFLKRDNLLNIANQIAVIAIIAIGMTLVIIAGGIDLSVGKLVALSAVTMTLLIRDRAGAQAATAWGMAACGTAAVAVCAGLGLANGLLVTAFRLPPFIVTLATMQIARGCAGKLSNGESINAVPDSLVWLGRGADLLRLPNAVVLMLLLYGLAHLLMTRMSLGRYIYAVGGNAEAARLSGVPNRRVLLFVYALSGALAGLGGVVLASQLKSGAPTFGESYELHVIAAVVVGGTSLAGGEGRVMGTLVGAFVIAVLQNGMNLLGVGFYTQQIVFGLVIVGAVLLDSLRRSERW